MPGNGVYSLFIAKSGGNRYSGSVYIDYYNNGFSAVNIDDDLIARGVTGSDTLRAEDTNRTEMYRDFNADLGGYIVKDSSGGTGPIVTPSTRWHVPTSRCGRRTRRWSTAPAR